MSARREAAWLQCDFETEQQRSTDPYFVLIVMPLNVSLTRNQNSRPDDTGNYNEDAENFDADTKQMDQVAYGRFEGIFHPRAQSFGPIARNKLHSNTRLVRLKAGIKFGLSPPPLAASNHLGLSKTRQLTL